MREIKYRAIDKNTGNFVYGFLSYADFAFIIVEPIDIAPTYSEPGGDHITLWHQIKSETIGQLTGLKDTAGTPIYESDIVYVAGVGNCIVSWDEDCAGWSFGNYDGQGDYQDVLVDLERIVGNIYENPELVAVK